MAIPSVNALTRAYYEEEISRTRVVLQRLNDSGAQPGRVIPDLEDLRIHDGRRIEATVMFLDICKFSQRPSETLEEQQTLMQVLALFFSEMIRIAEDYNGVVEKNTGDGLMVYFAAGADGISSQQRALAAALTMFSAADNILNPVLISSNIPVLDFRICMDHGQITVAKVGAPQRHNQIVAIGATANVASKMLAHAEANSILMGDQVVEGLPPGWSTYWKLHTLQTGWTYRATGHPYPFWEYLGRWKVPA